MALWSGLGQAATVAQLVGVDVGGLISMIIQAAGTARQNKKECDQLARRVLMISELLPHLQDPEMMQRPEIRRPLDGLDDTLREAHELVMSCQERSAVYRLLIAGRQAERFRQVQSKIDSYLLVFPFISHIGVTRLLDRIYNILLTNDTTVPSASAGYLTHEPEVVAQEMAFHGDDGGIEFTMAELAAATNNFAPDKEIGSGAFGIVYMGMLPDGREVAVKRIVVHSKYWPSVVGFEAEIKILPPIRHNHIIRFLGSCTGNDQRMLVYEHMNNGSLHDHLHGPSSSSSAVTASWRMRIEILLGVSRAIEYLQSMAPPVIHRDIKPANILLDATWVPRLSSFGSSLTFDEMDCRHNEVIGTMGYVAPEYLTEGTLKPSSDIYSFGVVMLQVLTGKEAYFGREGSGAPDTLVHLALPMIEAGELQKLLDKRPTTTPTRRQLMAVNLVARTAATCVRLREEDRPAISEVVAYLEAALELVRGDG